LLGVFLTYKGGKGLNLVSGVSGIDETPPKMETNIATKQSFSAGIGVIVSL